MIISLNWLKKYVDIDVPTDELVDLIGSRLVEVEETIDLAPKYKDVIVTRVVEAAPVPDSDHLSLCKIDDGGVWEKVNREENGLVQVVCGAPNVHDGMLAAWLPPESVVPETYGTDEPFALGARKLRGYVSNGMLASIRELELGDDHNGIVEIDPSQAKAGDSFSEVFGLNDTLLDIENKSLTHRPDTFGVIGFAREVAGILGKPAGEYLNDPDSAGTHEKKIMDSMTGAQNDKIGLTATIVDSELCPRYEAVVLDGFNNDKPKYLTEQDVLLAKSGMRPISPIVDVTNYLMLLTGQPLHAFDYDKLVAIGGKSEPEIIVRAAKTGEKLGLLDGKEIKLAEGDIVITSNNVPVALAGAMGGANTEIDANTQRIVIESATFNLYNLRGTQFRHGIFSEAITRFTKGQPPALTEPVLKESIVLLTENCGMKQTSTIVDAYPKKIENQPIKISVEQINALLGTTYSDDYIAKTLQNVGFKVTSSSCNITPSSCAKSQDPENRMDSATVAQNDKAGLLDVTAPWWRTDIHIPEDIIEEVGRLNGFDNIPLELPKRSFTAPAPDKLGNFKSEIRQILAGAGANEVITYSFVSGKLLEKAGQNPANSYKIINSISPELQYVRQSLTPSLLEKVYLNVKVPFDHFALFEINQVYQKSYGLTDEKVPVMRDKVTLALTDRKKTGDAYYEARAYAEDLFAKLGIEVDFVPLVDDSASNKPFEPRRSAQIKTPDYKTCFGVIGEYRKAVLRNLKLPQYTAGFELNLDKIAEFANSKPLEKQAAFQSDERDVTFQIDSDLEYAKLENLIRESLQERSLQYKLQPLGIYQGDDKSTKNVSFRLTFASYEKTLSADEIAAIIDGITATADKQFNAKVI
jgi:phenylalanyl-tRNA synthetase beta chain